MLKSPLIEFVNDCIARNQDADGLSQEELYGLYLSWCSLRGSRPAPAQNFQGRAARGRHRARPPRRPVHRAGDDRPRRL